MINQRTRNIGFAAERAFRLGGNLAFYFPVATSVACLTISLVYDLTSVCGVQPFFSAVSSLHVRVLALADGKLVGVM